MYKHFYCEAGLSTLDIVTPKLFGHFSLSTCWTLLKCIISFLIWDTGTTSWEHVQHFGTLICSHTCLRYLFIFKIILLLGKGIELDLYKTIINLCFHIRNETHWATPKKVEVRSIPFVCKVHDRCHCILLYDCV